MRLQTATPAAGASAAEFLMGGEAMLDGLDGGSGAPLIITRGVTGWSSVFISVLKIQTSMGSRKFNDILR